MRFNHPGNFNMASARSERPEDPAAVSIKRLVIIDVMRGCVIVLMAFDHASGLFNAGRYVTDSAAFYQTGSVIPTAQFLFRWMTHLCAPTFLFLAGWSLALSVKRREDRALPDGQTDLYLLRRGLFILLLDPLWMSIGFGYGIVFQVLYAIGGGLCCMILLRRLDPYALVTLSIILLLSGEALAALVVPPGGREAPGIAAAFLVTGGRIGSRAYVLYPLLPWLGYMILGWGVGRLTADGRLPCTPYLFSRIGIAALVVYIVVRGFNGYGNMLLGRDDGSLLQWLHVSKYPPSLSFAALELGIMFLCLALLLALYRNRSAAQWAPLTVFGQTPLFFYILHVHLLSAGAWVLGLQRKGGLIETFLATLAVLLVLYPACRLYRRLKLSRRYGLLRYL